MSFRRASMLGRAKEAHDGRRQFAGRAHSKGPPWRLSCWPMLDGWPLRESFRWKRHCVRAMKRTDTFMRFVIGMRQGPAQA